MDFSTHLVKTEPPLPLANLEVKLDSCPPGSRVPVTVSALSSQIPSSAQPSATSSGSQKRQRSGAQAAVAQSTVDNSDPFVCEFIGTEKASSAWICIVMTLFLRSLQRFSVGLWYMHSHLLLFGTMTSFLCRMACSAVQFAWASSGSKLGWIGEAFVAVRCV